MLDDKDVPVRLATITSLVDLKNQRTVPTLRKALDSDVPEVSFAAAKALWALDEPSGHEALVSVLSGETKTSSGFITKQKREALRMLHTPQTMFMFAVKKRSGFRSGSGSRGRHFIAARNPLRSQRFRTRGGGSAVKPRQESRRSCRRFSDALADSDWSVRAAAVHAIALRNDPALEADLVPLLDDKKEAVRVRAAAGYLRLGSRSLELFSGRLPIGPAH